MIKPWPVTGSRPLGHFRVFELHAETKTSPINGSSHEFIIMKCPDWVNVVALTPDDQLVMVEQYRHGSKSVELEIPGGVMDPGDTSPLAAGLRELREETGYAGENARIIGDIYSNPAIMANTCHTLLVENCRKLHEVKFDLCEDIFTRLVPATEVPRLAAQGKIKHSLVVVALYHFELLRRGLKAGR
jgi:ADP-ribose pyrophosphatase